MTDNHTLLPASTSARNQSLPPNLSHLQPETCTNWESAQATPMRQAAQGRRVVGGTAAQHRPASCCRNLTFALHRCCCCCCCQTGTLRFPHLASRVLFHLWRVIVLAAWDCCCIRGTTEDRPPCAALSLTVANLACRICPLPTPPRLSVVTHPSSLHLWLPRPDRAGVVNTFRNGLSIRLSIRSGWEPCHSLVAKFPNHQTRKRRLHKTPLARLPRRLKL